MLLMLSADGSANSGKLISSFLSEVSVVFKEDVEGRVDVFIIGYGFGIRHLVYIRYNERYSILLCMSILPHKKIPTGY